MAQAPVQQLENKVKIDLQTIQLREMSEADLVDIKRIHGDKEIMTHLGTKSDRRCEYYLNDCIKQQKTEPSQRKELIYAIISQSNPSESDENSGETFIGTAEVTIYDAKAKLATIEYIIDKPFWGNGIATVVCRQLLKAGFEVMKMDTLQAMIVVANIASQKVVTKCGMSEISRSQYELNGKKRNIICFEITKEAHKKK